MFTGVFGCRIGCRIGFSGVGFLMSRAKLHTINGKIDVVSCRKFKETARFKPVFIQDVRKLYERACMQNGVVLSVRLIDTIETNPFPKNGQ